jgi:hypothetical protein
MEVANRITEIVTTTQIVGDVQTMEKHLAITLRYDMAPLGVSNRQCHTRFEVRSEITNFESHGLHLRLMMFLFHHTLPPLPTPTPLLRGTQVKQAKATGHRHRHRYILTFHSMQMRCFSPSDPTLPYHSVPSLYACEGDKDLLEVDAPR